MFKYTICFIKRGSSLLMLNRIKSPVMGLWHGVGGKIEDGETPEENIFREIFEETDIQIENVDYKGTVIWDDKAYDGGMYVYLAVLPENIEYNTPRITDEGILDWKEISWVLNSNNRGIPPHVVHFLPYVLNDSTIYNHKCTFEKGELIDYKALSIYN